MLKDRVALVTGSTSGIGLGVADALAAVGAHVVLNGFGGAEEVEQARRAITDRHGLEVRYSAADMSRPEQIEQMMAEVLREFGRIDVLVNNAGIQHVDPVEEFPVEKWNAILQINLSAAFHTVRLAVPSMKAAGSGRIVNVASAHALVASPFKSAYVAAKHGIAGFTKSIALELAEHGITANAVCPGYVLTPLVQKQIPDTARARGISEDAVVRDVLLAAQPTKRFVTVEEVAALVVHLCSPAAASITGAIIPVDGGWTAH